MLAWGFYDGYANGEYDDGFDASTRDIHHRAFPHWIQKLIASENSESEEPSITESHAVMGLWMNDFCLSRYVFWTEDGTFDLGPKCMQPGDVVVVLFGGKIPYVLRPDGNKLFFIGPSLGRQYYGRGTRSRNGSSETAEADLLFDLKHVLSFRSCPFMALLRPGVFSAQAIVNSVERTFRIPVSTYPPQ